MPKGKGKRTRVCPPYTPPAGFKRHYDTLADAVLDIEAFGVRHGHLLAHSSSKYARTANKNKGPMDRVPVTAEREHYVSWSCTPGCSMNVHARRTRRSETHLGAVVVTLHGPQQCAHTVAENSDGGNSADEQDEEIGGTGARLDHDGDEAKTDTSDAEEDAGAAFEPGPNDDAQVDENEAGAADIGAQQDHDADEGKGGASGGDDDAGATFEGALNNENDSGGGNEPRTSDNEDAENEAPNVNFGPQELEEAIKSLRAEIKTLRGDQHQKYIHIHSRLEGLEKLLAKQKRPKFYSH